MAIELKKEVRLNTAKSVYLNLHDSVNDVAKCSEQPKKLTGMMTSPEQEFLKSYMTINSRYFEWGSGGSTDTFGRLTTSKIVSVENYQAWCDKVTNTPFVKCRQNTRSIDYKCVVPPSYWWVWISSR